MDAIASQITSLTIVHSTVYSDADKRKHQSSASLAFVQGIHRGPVNSPHKWPVTRKMLPFDDVIMIRKTSYIATPRCDKLSERFNNDVTWASWHFKSPAYRLFIQQLIQANNTLKWYRSSTLLSLCEGNPLVTSWFPTQRTSDVGSVFISWRHPGAREVLHRNIH